MVKVDAADAVAEHISEWFSGIFCFLVAGPCVRVVAGGEMACVGVEGAFFGVVVDPALLCEHLGWNVWFAVCCDPAAC